MPPIVEPARFDECQELTDIAHAAKGHWGYPPEWLARWGPQLTIDPDTLRHHEVRVLRTDGGGASGFYALALNGADASLEHFWLAPRVIGRGLGRVLFEHATALARSRGATRLTIEADPNAAGFYRRMGAVPIGRVAAAMDATERWLPVLRLDL